MQLRRKLFLVLSLMAMVPLLFLLFEVLDRIESDLEERTAAELHKTLGKMSQEIYSLMDNQQSLVRGLAKVPAVHAFANVAGSKGAEGYDARADELASFFLNYQSTVPAIQAIRFTDPSGKTLVKVKEGHLVPPKHSREDGRQYIEDIAYKPFFQYAIASDKTVTISDFERGKVAGEVDFCPAMVRYTVPIRDELDSLRGLLTVNMWGRRVDEAVEATLGGYPGEAYIAELNNRDPDRDGIYLYHENPDWRFGNQLGNGRRLSRELGDETWRRIKQGGMTGMVTVGADRMLFYRKYSPYRDRPTKWLLVIEVARDTVMAPIAEVRNWIGYLIGAVLVLSLLIARWAAARLARPVQELARIITRYADGDTAVRYTGARQDEIGTAGTAFNYLSESLEREKHEREKAEQAVRQSERLAAIGQMAAGIGHEINNPLMNIMSLANLIEESVPATNAQVHEDVKALQSEGRRCARIVQGVLNFARENRPSYRSFDLAELIEETARLFRHRMDASGIRLVLDVESPIRMEGDPNQLQQVLVNVFMNAIHASPSDSEIEIHAVRAGDVVKLEVMDNGSGLDEEAAAKVFNPFFTTKPEGKGTGLGLSVSYGIVQHHGGTISLQNREQAGVRVEIVLPIAQESAQQQEPQSAEVEHAG